MIISTIGQTADTLADIAIKNRLQIGMIFSVIKRMGSQVYNSLIDYAATYGYGYIWAEKREDGPWYLAEVWQYKSPVILYESQNFTEILDRLYEDWPDYGFAR